MSSTVFKWTIYDSSWLLKFSPNVQRPWWIFGHDNIYVHCFIRRTSLFCGSFEEQTRKNIPKRFRLTLHFSACRILAWRTIPEVFINEVRWLLRSQHDSMSSTHQIKLLIYTVLRLLRNLNMWLIRLSVRTQDSQSWKSSSILLWATIIYCGEIK